MVEEGGVFFKKEVVMVIYKYKLEFKDGRNAGIEVPASASLLKISNQNGYISAWYSVDDTEVKTKTERYIVLATGNIEADKEFFCTPKKYIDTVFLGNGLVFHIFKTEGGII